MATQSTSNAWLSRQRKSDLVELAQHVGLQDYEGFKKPDLEVALDEYLVEHSDRFASDSKVAPYFNSRNNRQKALGSPVKKAVDTVGKELKVAKRRTTKAIEDVVAESSEEEPNAGASTALIQTPGRALSLASRIPLPATPADVAEVVDRSTIALRKRAASLYKESGITEATNTTRDALSTVTSVIFVVQLFELYFLRKEVLADRYAFTFPAIALLGTKDHAIFVPDLFLLLTSSFWSPALLWAFTSFALPSTIGYFFNLTVGTHHTGRASRRVSSQPDYTVDPLTFSIVKALISYVIYAQGVTFGGLTSSESIDRINGAVYGGWRGVLTGTAITAVVSLYDAVLRK